jgi:hypothetical protein
MSFIEKNKAWLLPVLGVGVAAVIWFNVQTFTASPSPSPAPATPAATPGDMAQAPPAPPSNPGSEVSAPTNHSAELGSGLWDDLKPMAVVPPGLADLGPLESLARGVLSDSVLKDTAGSIQRLAAPRLWQPEVKRSASSKDGQPNEPAPDPDLVVHLPEGGRAWFNGAGYREQDSLKGSPWRVRRVLPRAVELQGPQGVALKPLHPPTSSEEKR